MKQRSFVKRNGKIEIKEGIIAEKLKNEQYNVVPVGSKADLIYRNDKLGFILRKSCAFVREYIPGEYGGFALPKDLDLSEITHTFVIIAMNTGAKKRRWNGACSVPSPATRRDLQGCCVRCGRGKGHECSCAAPSRAS